LPEIWKLVLEFLDKDDLSKARCTCWLFAELCLEIAKRRAASQRQKRTDLLFAMKRLKDERDMGVTVRFVHLPFGTDRQNVVIYSRTDFYRIVKLIHHRQLDPSNYYTLVGDDRWAVVWKDRLPVLYQSSRTPIHLTDIGFPLSLWRGAATCLVEHTSDNVLVWLPDSLYAFDVMNRKHLTARNLREDITDAKWAGVPCMCGGTVVRLYDADALALVVYGETKGRVIPLSARSDVSWVSCAAIWDVFFWYDSGTGLIRMIDVKTERRHTIDTDVKDSRAYLTADRNQTLWLMMPELKALVYSFKGSSSP
jgi:hypothetical protein